MEVTVLGMSAEAKSMHEKNASSPMLVTFSGMVMLVRPEYLKASAGIAAMVFGRVIEVSFSQ
jgi:hypothetical protein